MKKLALVYLLILLLISEAALRYMWKNPWENCNRHIFLKEHIPNDTISYDLADEEGHSRKVVLKINEDGFIEPTFIPNGKKITTLAFLGGSTTECLFVTDTKRFPYLTGKILSDHSGDSVRVLNAGSACNNLHCSLNIYLNKIVNYRPDFVVIMHSVNDVGVLKQKHDYKDFMVKDTPIGDVIFKYSYVASFIRQVKKNRYLRRFRNKKAMVYQREYLKPIELKLQKVTVDKYFPEYSSRLRILIYSIRQFGAVPILMTEPIYSIEDIPEGYENTFLAGISEASVFNDEIRRIAKEESCILIDLDRELPKEKEYFYDSIHYLDKGSSKVAEIISKHLEGLRK